MKVKSESEVAQLGPTPSNPMDYSLPGSSVHGVFQARVLEWAAIAFSDIYMCVLMYDISFSDVLHSVSATLALTQKRSFYV